MHKLLVANRGEIALRIIRTAKAEGISTAPQSETESESTAYLYAARILALCHAHQATLLHGGYGCLCENAASAQAAIDADITWLGPTPSVMKTMKLKHLAREVAMEARVICARFNGTRLRRGAALGWLRRLGIRLC
ncbi:carbamoyl-phosphate synthase L chain ATP-binding protein [Mycena leptocephala]|nr:carbamoyl-phosphate synthase L chain ATP-binding protein [Mycena leptocephala]